MKKYYETLVRAYDVFQETEEQSMLVEKLVDSILENGVLFSNKGTDFYYVEPTGSIKEDETFQAGLFMLAIIDHLKRRGEFGYKTTIVNPYGFKDQSTAWLVFKERA